MAVNNKSLENLKKFKKGGSETQSQNLKSANAPWSIRNAMRYIAAQEADPNKENALLDIITDGGKRNPTVAQTIAAAVMTRASRGYMQAVNSAIENIEEN